MPQIGRLIGGAGTGKTTHLLETMTSAKDRLGGDFMALGFASFTRAAREEAVDRASAAWGVPAEELSRHGWFRTVHSIVFRVLGLSPGQLLRMEAKADLEWISNALGVTVRVNVDEDTGRITYSGDESVAKALNCWELSRTSLVPLRSVVREIASADDSTPDVGFIVRVCDKYELAKRLEDRVDFADTLLRFAGIRATSEGFEQVTPEGDPPEVQAWLFDEQQDASPLLDAVCKRLVAAPSVRWAYVVGDPFQAIYGFAGSDSRCFMDWAADRERIMPKSFRCPRPILELGERCLRRMSAGYFDRGIAPADHDGEVEEVPSISDAASRILSGEAWLLIARTNYQANRIMAELMDRAIPFRSTKSPPGPTARSVGLRALWDLQAGQPVSGEAWGRVLEIVPSRMIGNIPLLRRGAKAAWKRPEFAEKYDAVMPSDLEEVGATEKLREIIASGRWAGLCDYGEQFVRAARRWGIESTTNPQVRVGTIHSVKGAEAENVALLTTTNARIACAAENPKQADEEHRVAYVGVTRARRRLLVVNEGRRVEPRMEVL